jgi:outer membrane protein OmpA-like peptidoglycan-associated protein
VPILVSNTENINRATIGATYQAPKGFFLGVGVSWNVPTQQRVDARSETNDSPFGDYWDWQVRIGYHPGVRKYVPPPPPPPPPAPPAPAPAPAVHNLSVTAQADPTTVEVGRTSTVTAVATSSINCAVTYRWTAPSGTFANPTARQTVWTAPNQEGTVPATVTVTCPTDGKTASATVNINVTRPAPVAQLTFEDVYFDFDRSTLRPEALRLLDDAVTKLQANPGRNIVIEGHTCSIGTAEYNLALGERRANAVRQYLLSRGITAGRLETRSYGEERPKYDNAREETRRLNRRAALVVKVQ